MIVTQTTVDRCDRCGQFVPVGQLYVADEDTNECICRQCDQKTTPDLTDESYRHVGRQIASLPVSQHLSEIVAMMMIFQEFGVDVVGMADCLVEAMALEVD